MKNFMLKALKLALLGSLAALAACDDKRSREEQLRLINELGSRYTDALKRYAADGDGAALTAELEAIKPYSAGTKGESWIRRDSCLAAFSEGDYVALEKSNCRELFTEYFKDDAEDQPCGRPSELLTSYFAAVNEPETAQERVALKDLAVGRVECLPALPAINISIKARYALLLRILQRQTGAQAGITQPEELRRKLAVWLWRAEK